jgi:hypothetical protein
VESDLSVAPEAPPIVPGLVVEFLGLPGAGKSTLAHAVAASLRTAGVPVTEPTFQLDHETAPGRRRARKLAAAARTLCRAPVVATRCAGLVARSRQRRAAWLVPLVTNWLYLADGARRCTRTPGVHLLDQGLMQGAWSTAYGAARFEPRALAVRRVLRAVAPPRWMVVVVEAAPHLLHRRLGERIAPASRLEREATTPADRAPLADGFAAMQTVEILLRMLVLERRLHVTRVDSGRVSIHDAVASITRAILARAAGQ